MLSFLRTIIPKAVFSALEPYYHLALAFIAAILYRFPSRKIRVVAVTGTKGKSTVAELISSILEEAGYKTALQSTVRFKIGGEAAPNLYKMTLPGRFFIQRFIRRAVQSGCDYAVLELTSEGAKQFRHRFIELDALIFTNLAPEHIESHGSYDAYLAAKLSIASRLKESRKKDKVLIINADDKEAKHFLAAADVIPYRTYGIADALPKAERSDGVNFTFRSEIVCSRLLGEFNIYNMLAAATYAETQRIDNHTIKSALEKFGGVRGRMEEIAVPGAHNFRVFVDYAHTPDSLEAVYKTFARDIKVCVLGSTGGGRDVWKRKVMGGIADTHCDHIILTNEDPYDEDPEKIVRDIAEGITEKKPEIIMDRREAIRRALERAKESSGQQPDFAPDGRDKKTVVLITGKGTDPYIMGPNGNKQKWEDANVAREILSDIYEI